MSSAAKARYRVRGRVRRAIFEAFGLRVFAVGRDADGGVRLRAAVSEVDGGFVTPARGVLYADSWWGWQNGAQGLAADLDKPPGVIERLSG